ncbi:MAG: fasciclin domain-containing protein [Bacteroidota bacterium]|nr:fasciclin domain-containing protein [Bacteroidota bacterium]
MNTCIQRITFLAVATTLLFSCKKKFNDFYAPPANQDPAVYQQLQAKGKFTQFLSLIDKAGYKQTLSTAGYWTIFAPTDSAFQNDAEFTAYLQSKGIANVNAIDSTTAQSIVQYLLVFNAFTKNQLDDYQSNLGWITNSAFKRRTAYYSGFYKDTTAAGQPVIAIASNRNNQNSATGGTPYFVSSDNNNKYIPFFTSDYLTNNGLSASDYNYFYPSTPFSGFNVVNARVTQQDITAQNGVIHIIDHVVTPLASLDQFLRTRPEYSEFRKLFERYMVLFIQNADATHRYQVLTGKPDNVLVKVYSSLLSYSPNNENFFKLQDNDGQRDGWSMVVPQNDSLLKYINTVLLESYPSVNSLPLNIIADFLNSHMWQTTLWPSKFSNTLNSLVEPAHINFQSNIVDKKMLSNGIFYGSNKVNEPNVFSTIYGKAYLNPKFSLMTRLLDNDLKTVITNPNARYTMFMLPDAVLRAQGFDYNSAANLFTYNGVANDTNRLNLLRILNTCVVETPNGELDNLGTPGFTGTGVISTFGGEVIKYNGNQIISAGSADRNITITIDSVKTAKNGRVIYINNLPYFSYLQIGNHLQALGTAPSSEYNLFWNYMKKSAAYDSVLFTILGTSAGSFYTVFAPNNNAIRQAITNGLLPGTPTTPNFNPTLTSDKLLVANFILYHVVDKTTIIPDKKNIGFFPTLLRSNNGDPFTINIQYPANVFEVSDQFNIRKGHLVNGATNQTSSNQLSNRTVIHLIDNYLQHP